ncbi:hypothetical protein EW145_g1932 [Phellinidium pouzarii]|uniref:Uncharacterized protein n=1 Tax=Phellinidium pouzarii TaxID=167371 RepID=A0A4S4LD09_9AGAM|nr:hypothetical protein EW145_g1932 [Phellinidium pouzarii]
MPGIVSAVSDYHAPEVQVPTLGSINILALTSSFWLFTSSKFKVLTLFQAFPQLPLSTTREIQHTSRPSSQYIDTDVTSQPSTMALQRDRSISGHRYSRSLEIPPTVSSSFTVDTLDSANSDEFIFPSSKGTTTSHGKAGAPLPGLYISQASRNLSGWRGGASIPPSPRAMSPLTPSPGPSSPINDLSEDAAEAEDEADSEDVWDLVPYDISWDDSANEEEDDCFSSSFQRRSDLRPQYARSRVAIAIPERPRANTEIHGRFSHDGSTPTLTKPALRRRHSTIELPVPLPLIFSDKPQSAPRETRLLPKEPGYLGWPLSLPGGDTNCDDLYPVRFPSSPHSTSDTLLDSSSASSFPFGLPPSSDANIHAQIRSVGQDLSQAKWDASFSHSDDTQMASIDMKTPDDLFQTNRTSPYGQNHATLALRNSISMPELEWAYQSPRNAGVKSFMSDSKCAEIDFEMIDSSSTWALSKADAAQSSVYPFDTVPPHIDIMEHTPNFLPFGDQQIDAMLGVSSYLAFSM